MTKTQKNTIVKEFESDYNLFEHYSKVCLEEMVISLEKKGLQLWTDFIVSVNFGELEISLYYRGTMKTFKAKLSQEFDGATLDKIWEGKRLTAREFKLWFANWMESYKEWLNDWDWMESKK